MAGFPEDARRLYHPFDPADYATGPGAGIDECLPTVLPCEVEGRALPDHGELWNTPPDFSPDGLRCHWSLRSLPLDFTRHLRLCRDTLHLHYRIQNRAVSAHSLPVGMASLVLVGRGGPACV